MGKKPETGKPERYDWHERRANDRGPRAIAEYHQTCHERVFYLTRPIQSYFTSLRDVKSKQFLGHDG